MKTWGYNLLFWGFCFLLPLFLIAQNDVHGKVNNWAHGESIIAYFGMFDGEMTRLGSVNETGDFQIPLDPDYINTFKKMAKREAASAPPGWTMSFKTVATTFNCKDEESITFQNADVILTGLPELILTDQTGKTELGILYAVSSHYVAQWLRSYGAEDIGPGYYLRWIFSEDRASASGECEVPTYTGNGEEMYTDTTVIEVDLEKGWNLIKYEITETFTSQAGKTYAAKTLVKKLPTQPDDVQWVAIGN